MEDVSDGLRAILTPATVIVGVGNRLRGDDAAGVALVDRIAGRVRLACIDAGVAPENCLGKIVSLSPDTVLLVDAADFGGSAGEARVVGPADLAAGGISTHGLSLSMVSEYLRARTGARIFVVAIQPGVIALGEEGLSPAVAAAVGELADILMGLRGSDARV
jgi:hydrogenase 3 maturation protease